MAIACGQQHLISCLTITIFHVLVQLLLARELAAVAALGRKMLVDRMVSHMALRTSPLAHLDPIERRECLNIHFSSGHRKISDPYWRLNEATRLEVPRLEAAIKNPNTTPSALRSMDCMNLWIWLSIKSEDDYHPEEAMGGAAWHLRHSVAYFGGGEHGAGLLNGAAMAPFQLEVSITETAAPHGRRRGAGGRGGNGAVSTNVYSGINALEMILQLFGSNGQAIVANGQNADDMFAPMNHASGIRDQRHTISTRNATALATSITLATNFE